MSSCIIHLIASYLINMCSQDKMHHLHCFIKKRGMAFILKKTKETIKRYKKILSRKVVLGLRKLIQIEHNLIALDFTRLTASQDFSNSLSKQVKPDTSVCILSIRDNTDTHPRQRMVNNINHIFRCPGALNLSELSVYL